MMDGMSGSRIYKNVRISNIQKRVMESQQINPKRKLVPIKTERLHQKMKD